MDAVRDLAMVPGLVGLGARGSFKWLCIDITPANVSCLALLYWGFG